MHLIFQHKNQSCLTGPVRQVQRLMNASCGIVNLVLRILMIQSNITGRALSNTTIKVVSVLHKPDFGNIRRCPSLLPTSQFYPGMKEVQQVEQFPSSTAQCLLNYIYSLGHSVCLPFFHTLSLPNKSVLTFFPFTVLGERFLDLPYFRINN